ncbi:MAG: thiamine pyrophosphate-dependent enzyme [Alphaproteobacteria bacterium]
MTKMTGGQAIVRTLMRQDVDTIFGLPGVQLDNTFDALYEVQDKVRVVHTRHEQGAAYMALGYAQATGKVGTCIVVPGPGVLNTGAALSTAAGSNAPVLCLTGQIPSYQIGLGLGIPHEIRDQQQAMAGVVKWVGRAETPAEAPQKLREAFRAMLAGRNQPAVFEMAPDVMGRSEDVALLEPERFNEGPETDEKTITAAAKLLGAAEKPVIFVGSGIFGAEKELLRVAELLEAPVVMSRTGRGAVSDRHYLAQNMIGGQELWGGADAVLVVGTRFLAPALAWGREKEVKTVRIDIDPEQAVKPRPADIGIVASARTGLSLLAEQLAKHNRKRPSRKAELTQLKDEVHKRLAGLEPQHGLARAIRDELPEDAIIVTDVTQLATYTQYDMPIYQPRTLITPGYQGTLGYAYPTGLGAQVAYPDRKVVVISGDGGFMFNVQELSTAVAHGINVVCIVFADGAFGNVKRIQKDSFGGRNIAVELHNPDFVALAKSFGMLGLRAKTPEELRRAVREAFAAKGPALIEVPVGELPNIWKLIRRPPSQGVAPKN